MEDPAVQLGPQAPVRRLDFDSHPLVIKEAGHGRE